VPENDLGRESPSFPVNGENARETRVFEYLQKQLISYKLDSYAVFFYYLHCPFKKKVWGYLVGKNFIV
jgi:hypothetical protein